VDDGKREREKETQETEVDLPPCLLNLLDLILRQAGQLLRRCHLLNVLLLGARSNRNDTLGPDPQNECLLGIDLLAGFLGKTSGDTLEDGFNGTASGVAKEGGETAVGLGDNVVFFVDGKDRVDVLEDVWVVF
jgi:hypothetical protein